MFSLDTLSPSPHTFYKPLVLTIQIHLLVLGETGLVQPQYSWLEVVCTEIVPQERRAVQSSGMRGLM